MTQNRVLKTRSWSSFFRIRYNWSPAIIPDDIKTAQALSGCEYVPMIWGEKDMTSARLANLETLGSSSHLLGFNEPNFGAQVRIYY